MKGDLFISVVMATLGGCTVERTISALNAGTVKPNEILICIPIELSDNVSHLAVIPNVHIVLTPCKGQVAQRAFGFQNAVGKFVLQIDDDIYLRHNCLEIMVEFLVSSTFKVAVAPKMYDVKTGQYSAFLTRRIDHASWFQSFIYWVVNGREGYNPGKIGRAGIGMVVPEKPDDWFDLDWLPGGCILHRRDSLILFNYYPFKGKAFAEDLFHSRLLRKNGVRLTRCGKAECDVDFSSQERFSIKSALKSYLKYTKALQGFMSINGGSYGFLYAFLILDLVNRATQKIMNMSRS